VKAIQNTFDFFFRHERDGVVGLESLIEKQAEPGIGFRSIP
jgi:hypothetical protein